MEKHRQQQKKIQLKWVMINNSLADRNEKDRKA